MREWIRSYPNARFVPPEQLAWSQEMTDEAVRHMGVAIEPDLLRLDRSARFASEIPASFCCSRSSDLSNSGKKVVEDLQYKAAHAFAALGESRGQFQDFIEIVIATFRPTPNVPLLTLWLHGRGSQRCRPGTSFLGDQR